MPVVRSPRAPGSSLARLASLARLGLSPAEARNLAGEFAAIVRSVSVVAAHAGKVSPPSETITGVRNVLRDDRPVASDRAAALLRQAADRAGSFIRAPALR